MSEKSGVISTIIIQHLSNEQIVHRTNIPDNIEDNKYLVLILRALADQIEKTGRQDNSDIAPEKKMENLKLMVGFSNIIN